jgi:ABC-type multidrug transport system fused ATPase/permease subunit
MVNLQNSTFNLLKKIWSHLSVTRKIQLVMLVILMTVTSVAEVISIGAVLPFLAVVLEPDRLFANGFLQSYVEIFQIKTSKDLVGLITIFFMIAAILAGLARIFLLWAQTRLAMSIGTDFSVKVFEYILHQPYDFHISQNSSELLAASQKAKEMAIWFLQPCLVVMSASIIMVAISFAIFLINPVIASSLLLGFGFIYVLIILFTKSYIAQNSQTLSIQHGTVTKVIQEGLGGIRDVIIDGTQSIYTKLYCDALIPMQKAQAGNTIAGGWPRFGIEALGLVLIAGLTYIYVEGGLQSESGNISDVIPILGTMAIAAQRLLPVLQQNYNSYIYLKGYQLATQDALKFLDRSIHRDTTLVVKSPVLFSSAIKISNLSFQYTPQGPCILNNINFEIPKGAKVGFVGSTGCGKSTLLDIIMGLLRPTVGALYVDDVEINSQNSRSWQVNIAHVPQQIFLTDASIAENIAFGVPNALINLERVKMAAEFSQIASTIDSWPNGYKTIVGERGLRLSGGQRQRIGIARAIYKRSNIIFIDEATSALDNKTEAAVMQAIKTLGSDITILIIAHRLSTLKNCDFIVDLSNGSINTNSSYEDLIKKQ